MKKLLALLLVLVLAVGIFAGCKKDDEALANAAEYLNSMYKSDDGKETPRDYNVVAKIIYDEETYTVTWTTNNENVKVVEASKAGFWTIDVPDANETAFTYTLTAKISNEDGDSVEKSFTRVMPVTNSAAIITAPVADTPYKLFMEQGNKGMKYYALGTISGDKYIATTTNPAEALDYYVEADGDGFKFYTTINGAKSYVEAYLVESEEGGETKTSKRLRFSTTVGTVWTYNANTNGWYTTINNGPYVLGTYGTYDTFSISEGSFLTADNSGKSQFPAGLMTKAYAESLSPDTPAPSTAFGKTELDAVYALADGASLKGPFDVTGVIIALDSYSNPTIVIGGYTDQPMYCYRLSVTAAVGDTITITAATAKNYGGTYEFMDCTLVSTQAGEGGGNNETPGAPTVDGAVTAPVAETAYKLFFYQANKGSNYYALGTISGDKYIATTTNPAEALDYYVEADGDGFKLYTTIEGVKSYVEAYLVEDGTTTGGATKWSKRLRFSTTVGTVWTYNAETNGWYTTINGGSYVLGTYGTYDTFSISEGSFLTAANSGVSQFPAGLMTKAYAENITPDTPGTPDTPDEPTATVFGKTELDALYALADGASLNGPFTATGVITELDSYKNPTIVIGGYTNQPVYCYRLVLNDAAVGDTITITAGSAKNYGGKYEFMDCTLVSIQAGEGGDDNTDEPTATVFGKTELDALYALADGASMTGPFTATGVITELDNYKNPTIVIGGYTDQPVYCYRLVLDDAAVGDTITITAGSAKNYGGKYEFMDCTLVSTEAGEGGDDNTDTPDAPEADEVITLAQAIEIANTYKSTEYSGHYTTDKYYITGTITEIVNTTYGNVYITDGTNSFYIYGLYDATGSTRYDALTVKPIVGDTITVYGVIGAYGPTIQMNAGWVTEHTPHTHDFEDATCTAPETCTICGATQGTANGHGTPDANGLCPSCGEDLDAPTLTETFAIAANAGALSGKTITWNSDNFVFTGNQANSSTAIRTSDSDHFRIYQGSTFSIAGNDGQKITKIVITVTESKYASILEASLQNAGATVSINGTTVTIELAAGADSVDFSATAQFRVKSFDISYKA